MDGYTISREHFTSKLGPEDDTQDARVNLGRVEKGDHRVLRFNLRTPCNLLAAKTMESQQEEAKIPMPQANPTNLCTDGEYILESTINAPSISAVKDGEGKLLFKEDNCD